jgi:hypothetical protein
VEQGHAKMIFQLLDSRTHRWLRQVQRDGGLAKAALVGSYQKGLELM